MNRTFMNGFYQGVVETAPASLSAAQTAKLAAALTILHLRHAGVAITSIHDFLVNDIGVDQRLVSSLINLNADQLETVQSKIMAAAFA